MWRLLFVIFVCFKGYCLTQAELDQLGESIFNLKDKTEVQMVYGKIYLQRIYNELGYRKTKKWILNYDISQFPSLSNAYQTHEMIRNRVLLQLDNIRELNGKCRRLFFKK